jgi:hypothetical protein
MDGKLQKNYEVKLSLIINWLAPLTKLYSYPIVEWASASISPFDIPKLKILLE